MSTCDLQVAYPSKTCMLDQDEEFFELITDEGRERIRIHEYDRVYDVPGLYEEVVYNKLQCDSPNVITVGQTRYAEAFIPFAIDKFNGEFFLGLPGLAAKGTVLRHHDSPNVIAVG